MFGKIGKFIVGATRELLTLPDADERRWFPPEITGTRMDEKGRPVIEVRAANYRDVESLVEGTTYPGDVTRVHTHVGKNRWEIHIEDWDTEGLK